MNLSNKKVVVMGLGLLGGGLGATKWLAKQGAEVLVTDLKPREELKPSLKELKDFDLEYVLGEHRPQDFKQTDMVIKNPAVKKDSEYLKIARENGANIETEISLFFKFCPCPIIGVTGTKGKSTVATLIHKLLQQKYNTILGGNIKTETLPKLAQLDKNSLAILELSSWQLSSLGQSPHQAVITNIKQDHLNRYKSLEQYIQDKSVIFKYQQPSDFLVLNQQDKISSQFADSAPGQVYFFNASRPTEHNRGAVLEQNSIIFQGEEICSKQDLKLAGSHNIRNALAAITIAKINKIDNSSIKKTISNFGGLPHRLELVKQGAVDFYNDSCATNPAATEAALNSFDQKVVLIAGGAEKDLGFKELSQQIAEQVQALILLPGEATPRLKQEVKTALDQQQKRIPINQAEDMKQAARTAHQLAPPHGVVLLSPACATGGSQDSMDLEKSSHPPQAHQFINEFDRGEKFKQAVREL